MDADDLFSEDVLLKRMTERILEAEFTDLLGYEKHAPDARIRGNSRNGKTNQYAQGRPADLNPRDREGNFDPKLIHKCQTRWPDFDD